VLVKILLDFTCIVGILQYITILSSWVEVLSVFKNLNLVSKKIQLAKKLSKGLLIIIVISLLLFYCSVSTDLEVIAIGDLAFYGVMILFTFVIFCALTITGLKVLIRMIKNEEF